MPSVQQVMLALAGTVDPFFASVVLLCHFSGTDAATTMIDNSLSAHTFTFNSGAQIDTAQFKFGPSSGLFALTDDSISSPDSADWTFGAAVNFTIEFFVRFNDVTASSGNQTFICHYNNVGNQRSWAIRLQGGNTLDFFASGNGSTALFTCSGSWTPVNGTWYYVVAERSGTTMRLAVDTAIIASTTSAAVGDAFHNSTQALLMGAINSSGIIQELDGWIDELRITNGVARYNGTYVVPTVPFPNS